MPLSVVRPLRTVFLWEPSGDASYKILFRLGIILRTITISYVAATIETLQSGKLQGRNCASQLGSILF